MKENASDAPWEEELYGGQQEQIVIKEPMPLIEKVAIGMFAAIALAALAITYISIAMSVALHNCSF